MSFPHGLNSELSFNFCVVVYPRDGFRFFWGLSQIYTSLSMTSFSAQPSKWIFDSAPTWRKQLKALSLHNPFLHSPAGERVEVAMRSTIHFLPAPSASTPAFIFILIRFLNRSPRGGGSRLAEQQSLCRSIIDGLLGIVSAGFDELPQWRISLVLSYTWERRWPRPETMIADITLEVSNEGEVDLAPWAAFVQNMALNNHRPARRWFRLVEPLLPKCPVTQLLLVASQAPALKAAPLFSQLLVVVSLWLEKIAEALHNTGATVGGYAIHLDSADDCLRTPRDVDAMLRRYMESARQIVSDSQFSSRPTSATSRACA